MPVKGIRGDKLAQEILRLSEQLEGDFRREFFDEIAAYADNAAIKRLLKDIDSGKFTATSSVSSALEKVVFASDRLDAIARKAMGKSARISAKTTTGFELKFNVINPEVVATARTMAINLSTTLNKATKETLRKIIQDAVEGNLTTLQAARKIRNHVGLIPAHSDAVDRYYDTLIQSGMKTKLAQKQADAYAQRLLKYRGETIARTEIARAVGEGQTAMWRQMIQDGYLPVDAKRVWITALDERTCQICEPMNGVETDVYGSWDTPNGFVVHPSAIHPNCRCSQGIVMPQASRSKVGKTSELELSQWLLSKFNPNHDKLGRFSSGSSQISNPIDSGYGEYEKQIASHGPRKLVNGLDSTGLPKIFSKAEADQRYGTTVSEIIESITRITGVKNQSIIMGGATQLDTSDEKINSNQVTVRILHGVAQAFEDAHNNGFIDGLSGLTVREPKLASELGVMGQYMSGVKEMRILPDGIVDYSLGLADRSGASAVSPAKYTPRHAKLPFVLDPTEGNAETILTRTGYAVAIHEIGHHIDATSGGASAYASDVWSRKVKNPIQTSPSEYGNTNKVESFAENFSAWFLLGNSTSPRIQEYRNKNFSSIASMVAISRGIVKGVLAQLSIASLSPKHPLVIFTTNGKSLVGAVSKFNPHHDELGRFTFSSDSMATNRIRSSQLERRKIEIMNAARAPQDWNNTRFNAVAIVVKDLQGFEDALNNEPTAQHKKVASRGPRGTKVGTDGLPILLSEKMANEKYGSTIDEVMQHIADNHGIDVAYDDRDPSYEATDKRILQGCAQFFDDASESGIDFEGDISEVVFTNTRSNNYLGSYQRTSKEVNIFVDNVHELKVRMSREYKGGTPDLVADAFGQIIRKKYNMAQLDAGALDSANGYAIMSHESGHALDFKETNLTAKATTKLRTMLKQNFEKKLVESPAYFTPEEIKRYKKEPLEAINRFGVEGYVVSYEDGAVWVRQSAYSEGKQNQERNSRTSAYALLRDNPKTTISNYSTKNSRETFAENFSAWFLLSKAKTKLASEYYTNNIESIAYTVAVSDGLMKQEQYIIYDSIDIFSINHPVGLFILSQTDSSEEDIEKYNPNHDEIGRFTFAPDGMALPSTPKRPSIKRKAAKTQYHKISDSDYFKLTDAQSKIEMTMEELITIRGYSGIEYQDINPFLRGKPTPKGYTGDSKQMYEARVTRMANEMTSMFETISVPAEDNFVVFRGVAGTPNKKYKVGSTFTDKGFSSTSANAIDAMGFSGGENPVLFEIRIPKGHKILPMSRRLSSYSDENEVLLRNGTRFRIVEIKKTPNDRIKERIVVEIIGD